MRSPAIDGWVADGLVPGRRRGRRRRRGRAGGALRRRARARRGRAGRPGHAVRAGLADEAARRRGLHGRARGGPARPRRRGARRLHAAPPALALRGAARGRACAGRSRPSYPPGTQRWYSNAGYVQAARLLEAASGMSCADYLAEAVLAPLGMDASLGLAPADDARAARVWQSGRYGEGELFNSEQLPAATRRRRAAASRPRAPTARSSRACSRGGAAGGRALLAAETVDEMLAPQFGPLPGRRRRRGRVARSLLGARLRRARAARAALVRRRAERAGGQPLRRVRHARLARPRARARPRGARQPRDVQRLVARAVGRVSALR